jgi:hypothetical protein
MDGCDGILLLCRVEYITDSLVSVKKLIASHLFLSDSPDASDKADGVPNARRQGRRRGVVGRQRGGRPRGVGRCPSPSPCPLAPLARASSIPHRLRLPNPCTNDRRSAVARCCRRQPRVRSLRHQAKSYRTGTVRHGGRPLPVRDTSIASSPRPR